MRVVTLRDFRDHATEMMRSEGIVMITRDGKPAGFFLPWDRQDIPDEVGRGIYEEIAALVRADREKNHVSEEEILADFRAARSSRR
jgi:hypothetical protein